MRAKSSPPSRKPSTSPRSGAGDPREATRPGRSGLGGFIHHAATAPRPATARASPPGAEDGPSRGALVSPK
ncbi:MAG: hypothetical protein D6696_15965, partial [Acidobacteria bacterium]